MIHTGNFASPRTSPFLRLAALAFALAAIHSASKAADIYTILNGQDPFSVGDTFSVVLSVDQNTTSITEFNIAVVFTQDLLALDTATGVTFDSDFVGEVVSDIPGTPEGRRLTLRGVAVNPAQGAPPTGQLVRLSFRLAQLGCAAAVLLEATAPDQPVLLGISANPPSPIPVQFNTFETQRLRIIKSGDVDGNGRADQNDLTLMQRALLGQSPINTQMWMSDLNGNCALEIGDIIRMRKGLGL